MEEEKKNLSNEVDLLVNNKDVCFQKLDRDQWNTIEKRVNSFNKQVIECQKKLGYDGNNKFILINKKIMCCGDMLYDSIIYPKLIKEKFLEKKKIKETKEKKKKVKGKKKRKTKDEKIQEIIMKKMKKKIEENLDHIINSIKKNDIIETSFISNFIELRLIGLLHQSNKYLKKKKIINYEKDVYELIIGLNKSIISVKEYNNYSIKIIDELENIMNTLKKKINFDIKKIFMSYPKLILITKYDKIFPHTNITPYKSQRDLIDNVINNEKCLIFYKAMIGSGKTTSIISISEYARKINEERKASIDSSKKKNLES